MTREPLVSLFQTIEEARYAMVDGNLAGEPVPSDTVDAWLCSILEELEKVHKQSTVGYPCSHCGAMANLYRTHAASCPLSGTGDAP